MKKIKHLAATVKRKKRPKRQRPPSGTFKGKRSPTGISV